MLQLNVHLSSGLWDISGTTWVSGHVFSGDHLLDVSSISQEFPEGLSKVELLSRLKSLNGFFSLVIKRGERIYAAVDRVRSLPLFYGQTGGDLFVSNDPRWIKEHVGDDEVDDVSAAEFLITGYVTGRDTLFPRVKQLKAGELLMADSIGGDVSLFRYYYHRHENYSDKDGSALLAELDELLLSAFRRLLLFAGERTIVVPLSGGYDSRLVVLMLKKLGHKNIIAFSYGRPGDQESEISRKLAESLGVRWEFVEFNHEKWRMWYCSEEWRKYARNASNLSSLPLFQDWPAVWEMKRMGLIPPDSIFTPGHGGLFPGGMINRGFDISKIKSADELSQLIIHKHYALWDWSGQRGWLGQKFRDKVVDVAGEPPSYSMDSVEDAYERWALEERIAKFIVNGVRAYEFWGYQWWLPLCDAELMHFWLRVPLDYRLDKNLYKSYSEHLLFDLTGSRIDGMSKRKPPLRSHAGSILYRLSDLPVVGKTSRDILSRLAYNNHPLAYNGIIPYGRFKELYTGKESRNSFLTLDLIEDAAEVSRNARRVIDVLDIYRK